MTTRVCNEDLEAVDSQLAAAGIPIPNRPLACFKKLHGSVADGPLRYSLFEPITDWYLQKYGDAARWDGIIARFPILIRDRAYLGLARFVSTATLARFTDGIEGLPSEVAESLTGEELRPILEKLLVGSQYHGTLYDLSIDDDWLGSNAKELIHRAGLDLANAAATIRHTGDTQTAIVQAHEAAEKYIKAALLRAGTSKPLKSYGHDFEKLFAAIVCSERRYSCLELPIKNLQTLSPSMEMRYSTIPRSVAMAVQGYHGALYVCAIIAQMWLFDRERGTSKSSFKECSFYIDGARSTFYCFGIQNNTAAMRLFQSNKFTGSQMVELMVPSSQSALYLEVTDPRRDAQLRRQLAVHMANRGTKVSPEEAGVRTVHGPEGTYTTALLRTPMSRIKKDHLD